MEQLVRDTGGHAAEGLCRVAVSVLGLGEEVSEALCERNRESEPLGDPVVFPQPWHHYAFEELPGSEGRPRHLRDEKTMTKASRRKCSGVGKGLASLPARAMP